VCAAWFDAVLLVVFVPVQNVTACMLTPECYQPALDGHLLLLKDEAAVEALLDQQPHSLDAVVVFPNAAAANAPAAPAAAAAAPPSAAASGGARAGLEGVFLSDAPLMRRLRAGTSSSTSSKETSPVERFDKQKQLVGCGAPGPPDGDGLLLEYVIRMNSSDVPPTQLLQDLFDVSPGVMPLPGNLLW
jgi:hypothetical protein